LYFYPGIPVNTWVHVVVRQVGTTSQTFTNGEARQSASRTYPVSTGANFVVGGVDSGAAFPGQVDEAWCAATGLSDLAICRICSCGVRGEQCTCSGTSYTSTGRNASACGSCTLPADCSAVTPPPSSTTTTSTTTTLPAAPSWVNNMLAVWYLD